PGRAPAAEQTAERNAWAWGRQPAQILGPGLASPEVQPESASPQMQLQVEEPESASPQMPLREEEPESAPPQVQLAEEEPQAAPRRAHPAPSLPEHSAPRPSREASWLKPWPPSRPAKPLVPRAA